MPGEVCLHFVPENVYFRGTIRLLVIDLINLPFNDTSTLLPDRFTFPSTTLEGGVEGAQDSLIFSSVKLNYTSLDGEGCASKKR